MALVNRFAPRRIAQNTFKRYRVFFKHFHCKALAEFHTSIGIALAKSLQTVGLLRVVAHNMNFSSAFRINRGKFHGRNNVDVIAFSEYGRTRQRRQAVVVGYRKIANIVSVCLSNDVRYSE